VRGEDTRLKVHAVSKILHRKIGALILGEHYPALIVAVIVYENE